MLDRLVWLALAPRRVVRALWVFRVRPFLEQASCHLSDWRADRAHMGWRKPPRSYWNLSSELIFQHHKLEKGLCLPAGNRRFFGVDPLRETSRLVREWQASECPRGAPVYRASIEVLRGYRRRLDECPPSPDHDQPLFEELGKILADEREDDTLSSPIPAQVNGLAFEDYLDLCRRRRSVRDFDGRPVDFSLVERAIAAAQLSPSACNRQPWHLHFYEDRELIDAMLALQNGNRGFGDTIPLLAVLTADLRSYFGPTERHEPTLDGGLFLMSFLLGLQSLGLSTCCLNWCVDPAVDRLGHKVGGIPPSERILAFLAIGRAAEGAIVPRSARRPVTDVIRHHSPGRAS